MAHYSRLNPHADNNTSQQHLNIMSPGYSNSGDDIPLKNNVNSDWRRIGSERGNDFEASVPTRPTWKSFGRENTERSGISLKPSGPWEHKLNEKHIKDAPPSSDTVRYFDPRRQTRRVFFECLFMWFWTAFICASLAATMYGFSTIHVSISQFQKYGYNALVTGLSIMLGLAFAAQFKQYAEMMRWRFLASQYRSLEDFELVLGCDSYRNTLRIMFGGGRPGVWYPTKQQIVAGIWLLVFVVFNVFVALIGLTYSIDVSEDHWSTHYGVVSVVDLHYLANQDQANDGRDYDPEYQKASANLFGETGLTSDLTYDVDNLVAYDFLDTSVTGKQFRYTTRTINSSAVCEEYKITFGGYAGFNVVNDTANLDLVTYIDGSGQEININVADAATGRTTWMGNSLSVDDSSCGPRCAQILALQSANNCTAEETGAGGSCAGLPAVPTPRLWACNNTVSEVSNVDSEVEGFDDPEALKVPNLQARYLAGAIGWSGVASVDDEGNVDESQYVTFRGDTPLNAPGNSTGDDIAYLVMTFSMSAVGAYDQFGGPRQNLTGEKSPIPAQVVNVKWTYAGAILVGLPVVQFLMLLGVVWFSGKAIILEPSYMTPAHLLRPVLNRIGESGPLLSVDEMAERLGDYKIAYGVRPNSDDPGHSDTTFVRDLDVIEESEGFGYIRGKMPEGRYD